jgi:fluoride exporter
MTANLNLWLVGVGGGLGAMLRYQCALWVQSSHWANAQVQAANAALNACCQTPSIIAFPFVTLGINVFGCAAIGLTNALIQYYFKSILVESTAMTLHALIVIGLLGGFTTFSSFGWETWQLLRFGNYGLACVYVFLSVCMGLLCTGLLYEGMRSVL